jgi:hypothetical protein
MKGRLLTRAVPLLIECGASINSTARVSKRSLPLCDRLLNPSLELDSEEAGTTGNTGIKEERIYGRKVQHILQPSLSPCSPWLFFLNPRQEFTYARSTVFLEVCSWVSA